MAETATTSDSIAAPLAMPASDTQTPISAIPGSVMDKSLPSLPSISSTDQQDPMASTSSSQLPLLPTHEQNQQSKQQPSERVTSGMSVITSNTVGTDSLLDHYMHGNVTTTPRQSELQHFDPDSIREELIKHQSQPLPIPPSNTVEQDIDTSGDGGKGREPVGRRESELMPLPTVFTTAAPIQPPMRTSSMRDIINLAGDVSSPLSIASKSSHSVGHLALHGVSSEEDMDGDEVDKETQSRVLQVLAHQRRTSRNNSVQNLPTHVHHHANGINHSLQTLVSPDALPTSSSLKVLAERTRSISDTRSSNSSLGGTPLKGSRHLLTSSAASSTTANSVTPTQSTQSTTGQQQQQLMQQHGKKHVAPLSVVKRVVSPEDLVAMMMSVDPSPTILGKDLGKGVLADMELMGFGGLWSHPVLRLYFFMYLLERQLHPLFFFRLDVEEYLDVYHSSNTTQKQHLACFIFTTYLSAQASMPLIRCLPIASKQDQQTYDALVKYVIDNLTAPPAHVFLDLDLLVARTLSVIYGSSQSVRGALAGSLTSLDRASTNSAGTRGSDTFTNSGQFQCLAHDFQDCQVMTSEHLVRIVQRVIDMPAVFLRDAPARIAKYLDAAAIEWRKYVRPGNVLLEATAKQASSFDLRKQASSLSKLALPKAKSDVLVTNENMSVDQHPFVKSKSRKNAYCEKCFQEIGDEDPYECEVCNYFCHKNCRNTVNVGCSALGHRSASVDDDVDPTLPFSTRLRLLIDRYQSAQKEIEVATNIRDGIVRISKAKGDVKESKLFSSSKSKLGSRTPSSNLASVSSSMAGGLGAQLEQSDKKISILRREQTRNLTLIALMISSVPKGRFEHSQSPEFPADALMFARQQIKDLPESAPVKIMFREHHHRASAHTSTSMMINSGMDTKETIESIIDKYNESTANVMAPEDVRLCFEDIDGTERTLSPEDRPIVIWHMLKGDVTFIIAQRITPITLSRITNRTTTENISHTKIVDLRDKRLAILMEIIETEKNYVDNLTNAIRFFLLPISNSGLVPKPTAIGIFSNMQDLLKLHTKILEAMNHKLAQDSAVGGRFSELFNEHMDAFPTSYTTYCGNLNSSQRTLTKLRDSNVEFAKFIRECESRRQLSRLTLDDILIQPLHRITRYPILLKRLLSATPDTHPDFKPLTAVTDRLGKITATVNEIVKRKENEYRIRYVQQNLNWNDQCDEFPLASIGRKLIFEKPLQMQMVQSQGRQGGQQQGKKEWVDVLSMVFNDLVLFVTVIKKKDTEQFLLLRPPIPMENLVTMSYTSPQSLSSMPLDHPQPLFSGGASSSPESMSLPVTSKEDIHAFQVLHFSKHLYTFQTISNTDRLNWLCEVENLANMFRFDLHLRIIGRKIQSVVMTSPVTIGNASTVVQAAAKETSSIKEEDDSVGPLHSNPTSTSISASTSSGVLSSLLRMNFGSRRISGTSFASMQSHDSQYGSLSHLGPQALGQGGINAQGAGNAINRTSSITRASIQSAMSGNITITPNTGAATGPGEEKSSNDSLSYIRPHRPLSIQPPPRDSSTHHSDYSTGHEASTHSSSEHITHLNNSSMVATATVMQQVQSTASPAQNSTNASFYKTGISSADLQNSSIASGMSSLAMSMSMSGSFASRTSTGHFGNHNSSNAGSNRNSIVGGNISNNQTSASGASVSSNSAGGSGNQSNSGAMSSGSGKKPLISDFFSKRYSANSTPSSSSARIPTVTQSSQGNQKDESVSK